MNAVRKFVTILTAVAAAAVTAGCGHDRLDKNSLEYLYNEIDSEIDNSDIYTAEKEHRIEKIKRELAKTGTTRERLNLTYNLINEYNAFISDSALNYVSQAENLATQLDDRREIARSKIIRADIESHAGLFGEAGATLESVPREDLDSALTARLYGVYCALYQYETEYLPQGEYRTRSAKLRDIYTDSLLNISSLDSFDYLSNWAVKKIKNKEYDDVLKELKSNLAHYRPGDRQYSIIASIMALVYKSMGDEENRKRYLAVTVISDIKGAVKENMAMRELATVVFEDGDIDRANHYVKVSLDDANFYSGRMHNAQSSRILPVIDKAYDLRQHKLQKRMRVYLYTLGGLLILFIVAIALLIKNWQRAEDATRREKESNDELQEMSAQLREMNEALEHSNDALEVSNEELKKTGRITEEYAGLFMEYSSLNISYLEKYHNVLRNLAVQGNVKGILKKLDTADIVNETLKVFYSKFDEAVLNIYPAFVDKINSLLKDDGQVMLKPGEKLNTELRILALMRIGINDAEKIAEFLRCSVSTIYTYRSRLKRRAKDPENFETDMLAI